MHCLLSSLHNSHHSITLSLLGLTPSTLDCYHFFRAFLFLVLVIYFSVNITYRSSCQLLFLSIINSICTEDSNWTVERSLWYWYIMFMMYLSIYWIYWLTSECMELHRFIWFDMFFCSDLVFIFVFDASAAHSVGCGGILFLTCLSICTWVQPLVENTGWAKNGATDSWP